MKVTTFFLPLLVMILQLWIPTICEDSSSTDTNSDSNSTADVDNHWACSYPCSSSTDAIDEDMCPAYYMTVVIQSDQYGTDAKRAKAQTYCEKDTTDEYKMAKAYCKGTRRRCGSPNLDSVRVIQPSQ
mmetsp:Transcript_33874/g.38505  ORF Transcript_33874/g.38505 Transcript_33874/m.38505 type:complete len:128 (+) Transcript_33874:243-626(+)